MTQPPPYGYSPPPSSYPSSGAPRQPDPWGPQQPSTWGQQPPPQWGQPAGQWGQQPPGQWGQQPPPYPPQRQSTNGFAIASLIFGILGGILLSVIFGAVALSQIKRRGQKGKGMAVAGLALSGAWLAIFILIGVVSAFTSGDDDPTTADGGDVSVMQLAPGQCLNDLKETTAIRNLPVVPCTEPHEGEVFAVFRLTDGSYPGDDEVVKKAEQGCLDRLETHAPKAVDDPEVDVYYLHPTRSSWRLGDKGVTCVAMSTTGKVTGSIQD